MGGWLLGATETRSKLSDRTLLFVASHLPVAARARQLKRRMGYAPKGTLVHQVSDWGSGAAAYFGWMSNKAAGQKTRSPKGCDENGPAVALLLSHVSIQICSFVAPCRRPILIPTPLHQSLTWCTRTAANERKPSWR